MAAKVNTRISPLSPPGIHGVDAKDIFVVKWETFNDQLRLDFVVQANAMADEMNIVSVEINTKSDNVDVKNANVNTKAQETEESASNAEASAQRAEAAVPIGDGYSQTAIDNLNAIQNDANFNAYGYTKRLSPENRFIESNTPNRLIDQEGGEFRIGNYVIDIERNTEITFPNVPFDPIANDSLAVTTILETAKDDKDIVIVESNDVIYQCISDNAGIDLTDISDYQIITHVTTQDVVVYRLNKSTKSHGYYTYRGSKYFEAEYSQYEVMMEYGYTQVDKNLWEDTEYYYVFIMLRGTFNAGGYHPDYNEFGSRGFNVGGIQSLWTLSGASSIYDCFPAIGDWGTIAKGWDDGNPLQSLYDKVYKENYGGILPCGGGLPCSSKISNNDLLEEEFVKLLSSGRLEKTNAEFETITYGSGLIVEDLNDAPKLLWDLNRPIKEVKQVLYSIDNGTTWDIETFTTDIVNNQITLGNARTKIKVSYSCHNKPLVLQSPNKIKTESLRVISTDQSDSNKASMLMYMVSNNIIQTGTGSLNKFTITKKEDELFSYTDEGVNTNPTAIPFIGKMTDGEKCIGVYGSGNNVIDTSEKYISRLGVYDD